jgi:glycosyltransferase involved in cell wall biosynthesis
MIFSVIVPFLNEEQQIEQCIQALLNQTLDTKSYELIFVDNGSTDRSPEIVRKYSAIQLLHETRRDPYLARNRGIHEAKSPWIAILNNDVELAPDYFEKLLQAGAPFAPQYHGAEPLPGWRMRLVRRPANVGQPAAFPRWLPG